MYYTVAHLHCIMMLACGDCGASDAGGRTSACIRVTVKCHAGCALPECRSQMSTHICLCTAGKGKLRVLRIGEPAKVRSCLQAYTLKAQLSKAVEADPAIAAARNEQQVNTGPEAQAAQLTPQGWRLHGEVI
jgi:hypothetical protein